jgi:hypothetical protein
VCLHAGNTREEVDMLIRRIEDWLLVKIHEGRFRPADFEKARI